MGVEIHIGPHINLKQHSIDFLLFKKVSKITTTSISIPYSSISSDMSDQQKVKENAYYNCRLMLLQTPITNNYDMCKLTIYPSKIVY